MLQFVLRRAAGTVLVIVASSVLVFLLTNILPGDAVLVRFAGVHASAEQLASARASLGLDQPAVTRYLDWARGLVTGELGRSFVTSEPLTSILAPRILVTLELALLAGLLAFVVGVPIGVLAGSSRARWVALLARLVSLGVAVPRFLVAFLLLLVFSYGLRWFPSFGYVPWSEGALDHLAGMLLPAVALSVIATAFVVGLVSENMRTVLTQDYIRAAQAHGLARWRVIWLHGLKSALVPAITVLGLELGSLLAGSVIVETIFSVPGLGSLVVQSISTRDLPVIQLVVVISATAFAVVNFLVDVSYRMLNPHLAGGG